jgi:hypothetical protein
LGWRVSLKEFAKYAGKYGFGQGLRSSRAGGLRVGSILRCAGRERGHAKKTMANKMAIKNVSP